MTIDNLNNDLPESMKIYSSKIFDKEVYGYKPVYTENTRNLIGLDLDKWCPSIAKIKINPGSKIIRSDTDKYRVEEYKIVDIYQNYFSLCYGQKHFMGWSKDTPVEVGTVIKTTLHKNAEFDEYTKGRDQFYINKEDAERYHKVYKQISPENYKN